MINDAKGAPEQPKKARVIKIEELIEKGRAQTTELAEKHGLTYDRYKTVKDELCGRLPKTHTEDEAAAVKEVDAEILALAKSSTTRMSDMLSIQKGFGEVARSMSESAMKPWKEASQEMIKEMGALNFISDSAFSAKPIVPKVPFPKIKHQTINDFPVNPGPPISRQILNGLSQARQDETVRHEETAKATAAMAKLMEAQVELTRQQMQSNIDSDKFNKMMLGWTLAVGSLTLIATVVFGIISLS
ncbi:UNVERIFIED_CONTAM: hypothetical protein Q9R71_27045 [Actinomycetes bacterium ARC8]|nr:hypothetical protein [Actinomycetes bacterium ARC8]